LSNDALSRTGLIPRAAATAFAAACLFSAAHDFIGNRQARHWPPVQADITAISAPKRCDTHTAYLVDIAYRYTWQGVDGEGRTRQPLQKCLDEAQANALVDQHPPGSPIAVRVDPGMPTDSVADSDVQDDTGWQQALVLGGLLLTLCILTFAPVRRFFGVR
jgi:hypothetical protein